MQQLPDRLVVIFGLYRGNIRMKENNIKHRIWRQSFPNEARWANTTYHRNQEITERFVKKSEAEQLNLKIKTNCYSKRKEADYAKALKKALRYHGAAL